MFIELKIVLIDSLELRLPICEFREVVTSLVGGQEKLLHWEGWAIVGMHRDGSGARPGRTGALPYSNHLLAWFLGSF